MTLSWFSYEDRTPEDGEWAIVWAYGQIAVAEWDGSRNRWWGVLGRNEYEHERICQDSKFWYPIPNPKTLKERL